MEAAKKIAKLNEIRKVIGCNIEEMHKIANEIVESLKNEVIPELESLLGFKLNIKVVTEFDTGEPRIHIEFPNDVYVHDIKLFNKKILLESMKNDKKRVGKDLTIVIPCDDEIRAIKVNDLTFKEFDSVYNQLIMILN